MGEIEYLHKYIGGVTEMMSMRYDVQTTVGTFLDDAALRSKAASVCIELADKTVVRASYQGDIFGPADDGVIWTLASNGIKERLYPHFTVYVQLADPTTLIQEANERAMAISKLLKRYAK